MEVCIVIDEVVLYSLDPSLSERSNGELIARLREKDVSTVSFCNLTCHL